MIKTTIKFDQRNYLYNELPYETLMPLKFLLWMINTFVMEDMNRWGFPMLESTTLNKYIKETQMLPRNLIDYLEMREIEI